jgi:hypothetical protein
MKEIDEMKDRNEMKNHDENVIRQVDDVSWYDMIWDEMMWADVRWDEMTRFDEWFVLILIWQIFEQEVFLQRISGEMWSIFQPRMIIGISLFVKLSNYQTIKLSNYQSFFHL